MVKGNSSNNAAAAVATAARTIILMMMMMIRPQHNKQQWFVCVMIMIALSSGIMGFWMGYTINPNRISMSSKTISTTKTRDTKSDIYNAQFAPMEMMKSTTTTTTTTTAITQQKNDNNNDNDNNSEQKDNNPLLQNSKTQTTTTGQPQPQQPQPQSSLSLSNSDSNHRNDCDLTTNLFHLQQHQKNNDYPAQRVAGPMQADEMIFLFGLVRTSFVTRILEIGGFQGDSAYNWLEALKCKQYEYQQQQQQQQQQRRKKQTNNQNHNHTDHDHDKNDLLLPVPRSKPMVYTVDLRPVPQHSNHIVTHKTIIKDGADLVLDDIDNHPIDILLLDCHVYKASKHILNAVLTRNLLSPNGYIILHDTGLHRLGYTYPGIWFPVIPTPHGRIHQPVERLLANWIPMQECAFQRISFHDDTRPYPRHGITLLQRRMTLHFPHECLSYAQDGTRKLTWYDFQTNDCQEIEHYTTALQTTCPLP